MRRAHRRLHIDRATPNAFETEDETCARPRASANLRVLSEAVGGLPIER